MGYSKKDQTRKRHKKPRARKCLTCRKWFTPKEAGETTCSTDCAILYGQSSYKKQKQKENRIAKQNLRNNDRSILRKDCQDIANRIGKLQCFLRGEIYCVTCGATDGKFDGGHFLHASTHSAIRYITFQINPQCVNCNQYNNGRYAKYKIYMIDKYGEEYVKWLESQNGITKKFTLEYLRKFKRIMGKRKRILEARFKRISDLPI